MHGCFSYGHLARHRNSCNYLRGYARGARTRGYPCGARTPCLALLYRPNNCPHAWSGQNSYNQTTANVNGVARVPASSRIDVAIVYAGTHAVPAHGAWLCYTNQTISLVNGMVETRITKQLNVTGAVGSRASSRKTSQLFTWVPKRCPRTRVPARCPHARCLAFFTYQTIALI